MKVPLSIAGVIALLLAGGCTTVDEVFPGSTPEQVWTALVATAQTPDYETDPDVTRRWHVQQNDVVTFPDDARIEIFRRVQRVLHTERVRPQLQDRTWRFTVTLDSSDPPRARFVSRGVAVPAHALDEANRYFDDVWNLLGGRPEPQPKTEPSEPEPEPVAEEPADDVEVDIDELVPD